MMLPVQAEPVRRTWQQVLLIGGHVATWENLVCCGGVVRTQSECTGRLVAGIDVVGEPLVGNFSAEACEG